MKKSSFKKTKKLLIVIGLLSIMLTPIYSMMDNINGYIWEIDYDWCCSCNSCYEHAPQYIILDGNDDPFFTNGTIIGGNSILLQYSYPEDPDLLDAYNSCPYQDLAFMCNTY